MRRLLLISLVCLWATAVPAQNNGQSDVEQRAWEMLNGRSVVARVYLEPQADPGRFAKVSIPVADGLIKTSAIKSVYPSVTDSAAILIWARDQTDTTVADALGRHLYVSRYVKKQEPPLQFLAAGNDYSPQWTFLDARGEPVPRASVEIAVAAYNGAEDLPLYKATLDEQGRLPRLLGGVFVFRVEHPNYGAAEVFYLNAEDDPCGIYVLPLVPRDSEAFAAAAQGDVIDSDGNPVAGALVTCEELLRPDGTREQPYQRILSRAVTDVKGWFALCLPTVTKNFELKDLPPAGTAYYVTIEPPKASNLRRPNEHSAAAGSRQTFTLQRMDSAEFFHTFAFEYVEGLITSAEELRNVTLTLLRDGREWRTLTYEQWKDGCSLPLGVLRAITTRWGDSFGFPQVELTADSPTRLIIKAGPLITYRGRVVDATTGEPLPGVFVLAGHQLARKDRCSLTDDEWQQLRAAAAGQAAERSSRALYEWHDRVAVTDTNGVFEIAFLPGFNDRLDIFTPMVPGYDRGPAFGGSIRPPVDGLAEVATIKLSPRDKQAYFPTFIFETETGPVTDPAKLKDIQLEIRSSDDAVYIGQYGEFVQRRQFTPGAYHAEVAWDHKYYTFEPMDLSRKRPTTVTFRPAKIEKADVTYEGRVVHGVTGRPVAGAIVLLSLWTRERDASSLTAEQWAAIGTLGPKMDPADPALAPLMNALVHTEISARGAVPHLTKTDSNGRFALPCELGPLSPREELLIVARDFLGARQQLALRMRPEGDVPGPPTPQRLEADSKGAVSLPPTKLFPAATVLVQPVLSDPGCQNPGQTVRLHWEVRGENHPLWVKDLLTVGREGLGASVLYQYEVQPNIAQTVYIPAGVSLDLSAHLFDPMLAPVPPARVTNVRMEQGQVADLGRLELKPGVKVIIKAVDSAGNSVPGVRIDCVYDDGFQWLVKVPTDAQGVAALGVPAHSAGTFRTTHYDKQTQTATEESTPYTIAGEEDAGKEFTLQLSDLMVQLLSGEKP